MTIETPAGRRSSSAAPLAPPGGQPEPTTGVTDPQLAVLLRQAQWTLDDAAHDFPAGRVTTRRREELAATLEALAAIVRASTPVRVIETGAVRHLAGEAGIRQFLDLGPGLPTTAHTHQIA